MKNTIIDKSTGYEFGTLWQEITNAVGIVGNTIVNGLQVTEKTEQLHDYYDIQGRLDWSTNILSKKQSNTGFYIIGAAFVFGMVFLVYTLSKR